MRLDDLHFFQSRTDSCRRFRLTVIDLESRPAFAVTPACFYTCQHHFIGLPLRANSQTKIKILLAKNCIEKY